MNVISNIAGTFSSIFKIGGKTGFLLKNNSGVAEVKNYTDGSYADLKANTFYDGSGNKLAPIIISDTEPSTISAGQMWLDTNE